MLRVLFYFGLGLSFGALGMGYDFSRQAAKLPNHDLEMAAYILDMPVRASTLWDGQSAEKAMAMRLPQVRGAFGTGQQGQQFATSAPVIGALLNSDSAAAKKNWWSEIRHKANASGKKARPATNMSDNLAAMRARNSR